MKVLLTIATYHLPFQNFIRVTSCSASSSVATLSCLGMRVMRYGFGLRDDSPLYPSRDMGSSGNGRISNAQSNREMARHSSLSTTWIAGQMRRLRRIRTKKKISEENPGNTLYAPCAERPMVPVHWVGEVARFSTSQCIAYVALRFESESVAEDAYSSASERNQRGRCMHTDPDTSLHYDVFHSN